MAELDFTHHVSEIPRGEQLPNAVPRREKMQAATIPDFQAATDRYAEATNWMSSLGSYVATTTSNAIATKMGTELGKNPQGEIGIPLTDFDKVMHQSYETQAQSTLGLQAQRLISQSNLELAQAPRLSPDMISSAQRQIMTGLDKIFSLAPGQVRSKMEDHYGGVMIRQNEAMVERMLGEQKSDRISTLELAAKVNAENAYSLGISGTHEDKEGDSRAGKAAVDATISAARSAAARHDITPLQAKTMEDTARQSYLSGKYTRKALQAEKEKRLPEFLNSLADNKPSDISDKDHKAVIGNILHYMNMQSSLRTQNEMLSIAKFNAALSADPLGVTDSHIMQLQQSLDPIQFEKMKTKLQQARDKALEDNNKMDFVIQNWTNPEVLARTDEKAKNKSYDTMVQKMVTDSKGSTSVDEAEVLIAASAGGSVPVFSTALKSKLNSGNPALMDAAARQIDALYSMNASHALRGLSDTDKAIFTQYKSLRDGLLPEEAAKIAIQNANQDPDTQHMNKEKWSAFVKRQTGGIAGFMPAAPTSWALKQVGLDKDDFMNPGIANEYGNMILQKYSAFFQMTNGDQENALKLVKQDVKDNYDYTGVNGSKTMTLHPIEKVLGYEPNSNVVPFIQKDVMRQMGTNFGKMKEAFNNKETDTYWDFVSHDEKPGKGLFYQNKFKPIQVKRYTRTGSTVKSDLYDIVLIGNSFNWDIALSTETGLRPFPQVAPYLGIYTYTPDTKYIEDTFAESKRKK